MHPQSLAPFFAIALHIAQRMSISSESANAKHEFLEAEMRRRLWWSLVLIESRNSELSDFKATMLVPTWDCRMPLNVNDFDLRPGMKMPPKSYANTSEALFVAVRGELGEFIRFNSFHLDFVNPAFKALAAIAHSNKTSLPNSLPALEAYIEATYLSHCEMENPLHYTTVWWARHQFAKYAFLIHSSRYAHSPSQQTPAELDTAISHALCMLECDTKLMSSPLTQPYRWLINFHFPFPAYVRIMQDIKKRPRSTHAARAWVSMDENYMARIFSVHGTTNPLFNVFVRTALQAWEVSGAEVDDLKMIVDMKIRIQQIDEDRRMRNLGSTIGPSGGSYMQPDPGQGTYSTGAGQFAMVGPDGIDWNAVDWNMMYGQGW